MVSSSKTGLCMERKVGVRLDFLTFQKDGIIHKKLAHSNADCGLRNAEFKTLKTGWSRGQNAERKNITHETLRMAQRSQEGYRDEFRMTNDGFILNGSEYS